MTEASKQDQRLGEGEAMACRDGRFKHGCRDSVRLSPNRTSAENDPAADSRCRPHGQGRASKPSPKPASEIGTPIPSSGVWKMTNIACLPVAELPDQRVVHQHLGDAAVGQAADEAGRAHVGIVDAKAKPARKKHAERRQHAQDARLLVGGLHDHHREADILAVLRRHELHDDALLILRAGRRIAAEVPVAVFRLHLALGESLSAEREEAGQRAMARRCTMVPPEADRLFRDEMRWSGRGWP